MKKLFLIVASIFLLANISNAQSVKNIHFEQLGKQIIINYDLMGVPGTNYNVVVYYCRDGSNVWGAPLKKLIGAVGMGVKQGENHQITWDALSEVDKLEGNVSFKIEATENIPIFSSEYYKYKRAKNLWLASAIVSGAVGGYAFLQSGTAYTSYKTATSDASSLRQKVQLYDMISPIALGIAGFSVIEYILLGGKQSKAKNQSLSFYPLPIKNGGGIGLAYSF